MGFYVAQLSQMDCYCCLYIFCLYVCVIKLSCDFHWFYHGEVSEVSRSVWSVIMVQSLQCVDSRICRMSRVYLHLSSCNYFLPTVDPVPTVATAPSSAINSSFSIKIRFCVKLHPHFGTAQCAPTGSAVDGHGTSIFR